MIRALLENRKTQTRRKIKDTDNCLLANCPYGAAGDELWVRETFIRQYDRPHYATYKADYPDATSKWMSPIYMPRTLSRITLKITEVSIEQVQDISEQDAIAEGLINDQYGWRGHKKMIGQETPKLAYVQLWDSLAKPGYRWDHNPLVWVLKFEQVVKQRQLVQEL